MHMQQNPAPAGAVRDHQIVGNHDKVVPHGHESGSGRGCDHTQTDSQLGSVASTLPAQAGADGQFGAGNQTKSAVCDTSAPAKAKGRRKAKLCAATSGYPPSATTHEELGRTATEKSATIAETPSAPRSMTEDFSEVDPTQATSSPLTHRLIELQRARCMYIRRVAAINLPLRSLVMRFVGFSTFDPKPVRNAAKARYKAIWGAFEGKPAELSDDDLAIIERLLPDYEMATRWIAEIADRRDMVEAEMSAIAETLPAAPFVASVRGLSPLSLAIIQAEARGDLETFRNPARLWTRLGWAVTEKDGQVIAQTACSRFRKAEVFARFATPFFTAQSPLYVKDENKKKTDEIKRDAGPYRLIYDGARARTEGINAAGGYAERARWELGAKRWKEDEEKKSVGWLAKGMLTPMHIHTRALRVMIKCALVDIFRVSKGMAPRDWAATKPGETIRVAA